MLICQLFSKPEALPPRLAPQAMCLAANYLLSQNKGKLHKFKLDLWSALRDAQKHFAHRPAGEMLEGLRQFLEGKYTVHQRPCSCPRQQLQDLLPGLPAFCIGVSPHGHTPYFDPPKEQRGRVEVRHRAGQTPHHADFSVVTERSEERRVGKECRSRWS